MLPHPSFPRRRESSCGLSGGSAGSPTKALGDDEVVALKRVVSPVIPAQAGIQLRTVRWEVLDPGLKHSGMTTWLFETCRFPSHSRAGGNPATDYPVGGIGSPTKAFGDDVSLVKALGVRFPLPNNLRQPPSHARNG